MNDAILSRVQDRSAQIGIVGQGYVGLPLGLVFCEAGFRVTGFDVDPALYRATRLVVDTRNAVPRDAGPRIVKA